VEGEVVTSETETGIEIEIEVTAEPHQVHARVANVANNGIEVQAGHQIARTVASEATANRGGAAASLQGAHAAAQTVDNEATAGDPAVRGVTAGDARPVVGAHDVMTRGAERSALKLAALAHAVIEAEAAIGAGAGVTAMTEGHLGVPAAAAIDTHVDARARAMEKAIARGASTSFWTSAARAIRVTTATPRSLR